MTTDYPDDASASSSKTPSPLTSEQQPSVERKAKPPDWKMYRHGDDAWLPNTLRMIKCWIGYAIMYCDEKKKYLKKPAELQNGKVQNRDALKSYNHRAYARDRVGFLPRGRAICIDIDLPRDPNDPVIIKLRKLILEKFGAVTYVEKSLSNVEEGKDKWHIFVWAKGIKDMKCDAAGIEIFAEGKQAILTTGIGTNKLEVTEQQEMVDDLVGELEMFNKADEEKKAKEAEKAKAVEQRAGATVNPKANAPATTPTAKPTTPTTPRSAIDKDRQYAEDIFTEAHKQGKFICPDNASFVKIIPSVTALLGVDRTDELMRNEPKYDPKETRKRIASLAKLQNANPIATLTKHAKELGVMLPRMGDGRDQKKKTKVKKDESLPASKIEVLDVEACNEIITVPVVEFLMPPRTTNAFVGPTGSMKTKLLMDRIKAEQQINSDTACMLIMNDMPNDQIAWYVQAAGVDLQRTMVIPLQGTFHIDLEELIALTKKWLKQKKLGKMSIIAIDTLVEFCRQAWPSLNLPITFDGVKCAATPHFSHTHILQRLANEFNCCLVGVEHNSRVAEGRDNFPGNSKWEGGFTGACYRIYWSNRTQGHKVPREIGCILHQMGRDWRMASTIKNRFLANPDFVFRFHNGVFQYEWVDDLPESESEPELTAESYRAQLIEDMKLHTWKIFGYKELMKISTIKLPHHEWVGFLHKIAKPMPNSVRIGSDKRCSAIGNQPIAPGLYRDLYKNNRHRICYLTE